MQIEVRHSVERSRFEAWSGDAQVGVLEYRLGEGRIAMTHTLVNPAYEGLGVGGALVRAALDDVRASRTEAVVPSCWFVRQWIQRNPEYRDLLHARPAAAE